MWVLNTSIRSDFVCSNRVRNMGEEKSSKEKIKIAFEAACVRFAELSAALCYSTAPSALAR